MEFSILRQHHLAFELVRCTVLQAAYFRLDRLFLHVLDLTFCGSTCGGLDTTPVILKPDTVLFTVSPF